MDKNELSASQEDYLETILQIQKEKGTVRAREIADRLKVTPPSVTGALQALNGEGLVHHEPYDFVTLSEKGARMAEDILHRHETLREFFVAVLKVDQPEATKAACAMEHALSPVILKKLVAFLKHFRREESA